MEDKTTPYLQPEEHDAILTGSDFLTGREAQLQSRLDEVEAELAALGDVPNDAESLEQLALNALRTLSDLLAPPTPEPLMTPPPVQTAGLASARTGRRQAVSRRRFWRIGGIAAAFVVVALAAFYLAWTYGPDLVQDNNTATVVVQATATHISVPPSPTNAPATRPPATATLVPPPTIAAPVIRQRPIRQRKIVQAETVQILDVSGTLRLELPLSVMADTVQVVEGMPVLQPMLPDSGAGVHRGSIRFGEVGSVVVAIPTGAAPASLWQTRPGDRLIGCNGDGACHEYQVTAAGTWPLEWLHQLLANWPADAGVLLYTVLEESSAWVVQAQPLSQEETK